MCDYCGRSLGTDLHHLVSRGRTHTAAAREASESLYLFSWLCQDCHIGSNNVHTRDRTQVLLAFNASLFGEENVRNALAEVNQYLRQPIIMEEMEDGEA
jgi:hypothetical protein